MLDIAIIFSYMKDNAFKSLLHIADNYTIVSSGQEVSKGYKPDTMLQNGINYIIMECDTSTTRKGFVGGMVKAAKFLTDEKTGIIIFVLKEKKNTTVDQIHLHLKPYFEWIKPLTNLKAVYVIASDKYCSSKSPLKLLEIDFMKHARVTERT